MACSFILTVYNKERYLKQVLAHVCQERQRFGGEIIIVDDGSTDNSPDIIAAFPAEENNITVIRQENAGVMAATSTGLTAAKGELVRLVDGDDLIELGSTSVLEKVLTETGLELAFGQNRYYDDQTGEELAIDQLEYTKDVKIIADPLAATIRNQQFAPSAMMMTGTLAKKILPFPNKLRSSQDFVISARSARHTNFAKVAWPCCFVVQNNEDGLHANVSQVFATTIKAALILAEKDNWETRYKALALKRNSGRVWHYLRREKNEFLFQMLILPVIKIASPVLAKFNYVKSMQKILSFYE